MKKERVANMMMQYYDPDMNKVHQINEQFLSHEMLKKPMIITSFMLPPVWP